MEELSSGDQDGWTAAPLGSTVAALDLTDDQGRTAPGRHDPSGRYARPGSFERPGSFDRFDSFERPGSSGRPGADRSAAPPAPRVPFATFAEECADSLLALTYLLTADRDRAEGLLRAALAQAAIGWARSHREPEDDVLRVIARRSAGRWWRDEPQDVTDRPALPGPIGAGLDRLSRRGRTALVLRYHHGRTEEEVAALIGAPAGNVRSWLSRALDALDVDSRLLRADAGPRLSRAGLTAALAALAVPAIEPGSPGLDRAEDRLADVRSRLPALRRRDTVRRTARALAIGTLAVALVAGLLTLAGPPADPALDGTALDGTAAAPTAPAELFAPQNRPDPTRFVFDPDLAGDPLIAGDEGERGRNEAMMIFVPPTTNLAFSVFCRARAGPEVWMRATLNGHELTSGPCSAEDRANATTIFRDDYPRITRAGYWDLGVRPGRESELRVRLITPKGRPAQSPRARVGAGVYALTGARVVSRGVVLKQQVEDEGRAYRLGGYRTLRVSRTRRALSLSVPAVPAGALITVGVPDPHGDDYSVPVPLTVDGHDAAAGTAAGTVTFPLADGRRHEIAMTARPEDTGVMFLAWYRPDP